MQRTADAGTARQLSARFAARAASKAPGWLSRRYIERSVGADVFCVGENFVDLHWNGADLDHNQDEGAAPYCCRCRNPPFFVTAAAAAATLLSSRPAAASSPRCLPAYLVVHLGALCCVQLVRSSLTTSKGPSTVPCLTSLPRGSCRRAEVPCFVGVTATTVWVVGCVSTASARRCLPTAAWDPLPPAFCMHVSFEGLLKVCCRRL
jgi:hypothetical protein